MCLKLVKKTLTCNTTTCPPAEILKTAKRLIASNRSTSTWGIFLFSSENSWCSEHVGWSVSERAMRVSSLRIGGGGERDSVGIVRLSELSEGNEAAPVRVKLKVGWYRDDECIGWNLVWVSAKESGVSHTSLLSKSGSQSFSIISSIFHTRKLRSRDHVTSS